MSFIKKYFSMSSFVYKEDMILFNLNMSKTSVGPPDVRQVIGRGLNGACNRAQGNLLLLNLLEYIRPQRSQRLVPSCWQTLSENEDLFRSRMVTHSRDSVESFSLL